VITHAIRNQIGPFKNVKIGGAHIHHLVWGIAILHLHGYAILAGLEAFVHRRWAHRVVAVGYGAGTALTLDEFALWLRLEDVYWAREGRASIDAVAIFGGILAMGAWGGRFLHGVARDLIWVRDFERRHFGAWLQETDHPHEKPQGTVVLAKGDRVAGSAAPNPSVTNSN
jgi:hypothetical protein